MSKRLFVYVAGPLSAATPEERLENVEAACVLARKVLAKGHWCFIPHLTEFFSRMPWIEPLTYEDYMAWDNAILLRCDALIYERNSPGTHRERVVTELQGKPIYTSVDDLPSVEEEGREGGPSCNEASLRFAPPGPDDWKLTVGTVPDSEAHRAVTAEGEALRGHRGPWWRWPHLAAFQAEREKG